MIETVPCLHPIFCQPCLGLGGPRERRQRRRPVREEVAAQLNGILQLLRLRDDVKLEYAGELVVRVDLALQVVLGAEVVPDDAASTPPKVPLVVIAPWTAPGK